MRVLIVDDQAIVRRGLRSLLESESDIEIIGEASNGSEAVEAVRTSEPDVVLMDLRMPGVDGIAATQLIRKDRPETRVLVLTSFDDDNLVDAALEAGACGYVLKDAGSENVALAIRSAMAGISSFGPGLLTKILERRPADEPLSENLKRTFSELNELDQQIVSGLARGQNNREIAARLFLSEGTVKNHVSRILARLNLRDRTQLAIAMQPIIAHLDGRR